MEVICPLNYVAVYEICKCKKGVMTPTGSKFKDIKQKDSFVHKCNACGKIDYFSQPYPITRAIIDTKPLQDLIEEEKNKITE